MAACGLRPLPPPAAPPATPPSAWAIADSQGVELLARLVQADTRQPAPHEASAARLLRDFLRRAGVDATLVDHGGNRASVFARLDGDAPEGAAPLVLLSHLDTHPFNAAAWPEGRPPLGAVIRQDALWGRGVLDGKGLAATHALALATLREADLPLARPVLLVAAAGGLEPEALGLSQVIVQHPELGNAFGVLTKGGGTWLDLLGDGRAVHAVGTSERGHARLRITAATRSDEVHLETSPAVDRLHRAMDLVLGDDARPRLTPPTIDTLRYASADVYFPKSFVMRRAALARLFLVPELADAPSTRPLVRDTFAITRLVGGLPAARVLPDRVAADVDCGLLPGTTPGQVRNRMRARIQDPDVHITVLHGRSWSGGPTSEAVLGAVAAAARIPDADQVTVPWMSPDPTGAWPLRDLEVPVYGFTPFALDGAAWGRVRERAERLPLDEYRRGVRTLVRLVGSLAGGAPPVTPPGSRSSPPRP